MQYGTCSTDVAEKLSLVSIHADQQSFTKYLVFDIICVYFHNDCKGTNKIGNTQMFNVKLTFIYGPMQ